MNGEVLDQKKIDRMEFKNLIIENIVIISRWDFCQRLQRFNVCFRALRHQLIIPDFRGFTTKIDEIFMESRKISSGKNISPRSAAPQLFTASWE